MIDLLQERGKKGSHGWLSLTIPQSSKEKITFLEPTSEWLILYNSKCVCIYMYIPEMWWQIVHSQPDGPQ